MRNRLRRSISRQPARCHDLPGPQHPAHPYLGSHRTADREPRLSPSSARLSGLGQAIFRYTGCVLHSIIQCSPAQCSHKGRLPRLAGPVSGASIPLPTSCCRCSRSKLPLSGGAPRMECAHRRQPALVRPARLASLAFFPLCPTASLPLNTGGPFSPFPTQLADSPLHLLPHPHSTC